MHFSLRATSLLLVIGLAACGGLEKTDITPDRLMYGKLATFTVNGPNLDKGITFNAPSCSGIAEVVASAAPTEKVYTCTPAVTGPMTVAVVGGGVVLRSMTLTIAVPQVTLATSLGDMVMELDPVKAPLSVNNFLQYVNTGFYSKLLFHRVISGFMIQAGGFDATLTAVNTRPPITLESNNGLINLRGTLAMARTDVPNSGTSQFYINVIDNPPLDYVSAAQPGYAVFGKVVTGMAVADAIGAVPTGVRNGMNDVPLTDVVILSATQTQ